ncbi:MAG TPA: IS3 family transposase [Aquella sp.]|nr:IS3 family transposase [Aquella sp.]
MSGSKKNLNCLSLEQKKALVDNDISISVRRQCELLQLSRSNLYYKPKPIDEEQLKTINLIDEIYTAHPYYGTRRMLKELEDYGISIGRQRVSSYYKILGLEAVYPKINLSKRNHEHKVYPYLLRHLRITRVNQVWSADVTYIRLKHGFVYLVAIIDWYSRRILSWRLSTTLHPDFCVEALKEALEKYPHPEIFNTDQGSQFTSQSFISVLTEHRISISMDGRGRALDNVFIERFWRSLKQEKIYLIELNSVYDAKMAITEYMEFYNCKRKHQSLNYKTPNNVYCGIMC